MHLYTSVYISIHQYTSVYICIHLYTSVYICIHLYTSVYICISCELPTTSNMSWYLWTHFALTTGLCFPDPRSGPVLSFFSDFQLGQRCKWIEFTEDLAENHLKKIYDFASQILDVLIKYPAKIHTETICSWDNP